MKNPAVKAFLHEQSSTWTYVVHDGRSAAIVDPALDYDYRSGHTSTASAEAVAAFVREAGLAIEWILETHAHADHLSAAPFLQRELGGRIAIGEGIRKVQSTFKDLLNLEPAFVTDGTQFDHLFVDGDEFKVGSIAGSIIGSPGHTPACITYVVGDAAFVGDTLFMPDFGTARTDFPGGDAGMLFDSIQKILALPDSTRLFMCHDYKAPGRDEFAWETSVAEQRASNVHVGGNVSRDEFVAMRERRDAELGMPRLILPSIQVNVRAGRLPEPEANGVSYPKIPLDAL